MNVHNVRNMYFNVSLSLTNNQFNRSKDAGDFCYLCFLYKVRSLIYKCLIYKEL